jgi:hypothetical protein
MFALYCDDSGTHSESDIAVAACWVSDELQWKHFGMDWTAANEVENFGVFHMADFVARKQQFADKEWNDEKRDRTIRRLINIIVTRRKHGFFAAVEKEAYDAEVPEELRTRYKLGNNHYTFAVRMCMGKVAKWRKRHAYKEPVQFVFDRMSKGRGEIDAVFELALKEGEEKALRENAIQKNGWSFANKAEVLPLQAADILAWETLRYMQKVYLATEKESVRKSYKELIEVGMDPGYHNRETLKALIAHIKEREGQAKDKSS